MLVNSWNLVVHEMEHAPHEMEYAPHEMNMLLMKWKHAPHGMLCINYVT